MTDVVERLAKLVRGAYSEGFSEGMREHSTSRGGKLWQETSANAQLEEILSRLRPLQEQEAVAWTLKWPLDSRVNAATTFNSREKAEAYAASCSPVAGELPTTVPLYASPPVALPEGWKLVPIKPTREMCEAGQEENTDADREADIYAAMLAASPGAPIPEGWRDISTAPDDGTQVDLWCQPRGLSAGGYGRVPDCWFSVGKWWRHDVQHGDDMCRREVHNATHWMPRPESPRAMLAASPQAQEGNSK